MGLALTLPADRTLTGLSEFERLREMPAQKTGIRGELDPLHPERINQGQAKPGLLEHSS